MQRLHGYRFEGDVVTGTQTAHLIGEFQAPDRVHQLVTTPAGTIEVVLIGAKAYRRVAPSGAWEQVAGATSGDPRAAFATLAKAASKASGPGTYAFSLTGEDAKVLAGAATDLSGTATVTTGHITDLQYRTTAATAVNVHLTYKDFNAAPPVTAPA
jgi:hypothetical protein